MKKKIIIISFLIILIAIIIGVVVVLHNNNKNNQQQDQLLIKMETNQDLEEIINTVNKKANIGLNSLATNVIDITDKDSVTSFTGLESNQNIEAVVVSEPMMSSQAYSFVLVKTSEDADVESIKQKMIDNINTRKWICVSAEKVYVTNYKNLICLVMSSEEWAKPVYTEFKNLVNGQIGKELEKSETVDQVDNEQLPKEEETVTEKEEKPQEENNKPEEKPQEETLLINFETAQNIETIINTIYSKANLEMPALATNIIDVSDSDSVSFFTGLKSNQNVQAVVVSEPMMSSQAYSLVLVKVSKDADIESMKQEMLNNIDVRKWICVSAEKVYVTNYKNLICLVMSSEDRAKPVYNQFKNLVNGKVGKELVRSEQE